MGRHRNDAITTIDLLDLNGSIATGHPTVLCQKAQLRRPAYFFITGITLRPFGLSTTTR